MAAFSDGVIAILITIMVLELKVPHGPTWADLATLSHVFYSYVISFIYLAIYWNNHHHLLHTVRHVNGRILWANMYLLFWLSLVPFATAWLGENKFAELPTAVYGFSLLMPAVAYYILQTVILRSHGSDSVLAKALGSDLKGKASLFLYAAAIGLAFINPLISDGIYLFVALMWLVPDRRIERMVS